MLKFELFEVIVCQSAMFIWILLVFLITIEIDRFISTILVRGLKVALLDIFQSSYSKRTQ